MESSEWDARYAAAPELVWTAEPNRFVVEEVAKLAPGRALDLAAGEGRNAVWLAERGWQTTAVDFSPVAIERGRQLARERGVQVRWEVADLLKYRPTAGGADLVLLIYLHLPAAELASVLHRAAAALAPGGTLLSVGHDLANLTAGVGGPQDPAVLHTPEAIVAELAGLQIKRAETARRPVTVDAETVDALDTVVVAVQPKP
ncbi:MAG TPA: class I SAM-dependent methyltransferase [Micromonosporaceae bacterium]|nr:class I SAM-dependent methyltransferase [Micromonosporaceae bacterium]